MRSILAAVAAVILVAPACAKEKQAGTKEVAAEKVVDTAVVAPIDLKAAKSGDYVPDPNHRVILFSYLHQGYSTSYVRWRDWTGTLKWNAETPEKSSVNVSVNADKVDSGVDVFDGHLRGEKFFDTAKHPTITFASTSLKRTGSNTGAMTGDLTIKGVKKPVNMDVVINKAGFEQRGNLYKLGFSAKGKVKRSDWGLDAAIPFIGDEVTIIIEAEFQQPAAPAQ